MVESIMLSSFEGIIGLLEDNVCKGMWHVENE
jgi:hypothetical protein